MMCVLFLSFLNTRTKWFQWIIKWYWVFYADFLVGHFRDQILTFGKSTAALRVWDRFEA